MRIVSPTYPQLSFSDTDVTPTAANTSFRMFSDIAIDSFKFWKDNSGDVMFGMSNDVAGDDYIFVSAGTGGNFGIGTITPTSKLEVDGLIK